MYLVLFVGGLGTIFYFTVMEEYPFLEVFSSILNFN